MKLGSLIDRTSDQANLWTWDSCCICGDKPTDFGLYVTGTGDSAGPNRDSQIVRVAWCDSKGCVEDRLGTPYIAIPDDVIA